MVEGSTAPAAGANPAANAGPVEAPEANKGSQQVCTSDCVALHYRGMYHLNCGVVLAQHLFDSHNPAGAIGQGGSCDHGSFGQLGCPRSTWPAHLWRQSAQQALQRHAAQLNS